MITEDTRLLSGDSDSGGDGGHEWKYTVDLRTLDRKVQVTTVMTRVHTVSFQGSTWVMKMTVVVTVRTKGLRILGRTGRSGVNGDDRGFVQWTSGFLVGWV